MLHPNIRAVTRSALTKRSLGQRLAAYFALLAIAIQCFVVQPHVDPVAITTAQAVAITHLAADQNAASLTDETKHSAATCIICQASLTGGAGLASTPSPTLVAYSALSVATPLPTAPAISTTPSHTWRSRGPPTLI